MTSTRSWSTKQDAIFVWFASRLVNNAFAQHLIVRARAGTGKTTTILEGIARAANPSLKILVCAFSKIIQLELEKRITGGNALARTLHAIGLACIKRFRDNIKVAFDSERADKLARIACGPLAPDTIVRLVSKLHTKGREIAPHATQLGDLTNVMIQFECEPDDEWADTQYNSAYVEQKSLDAMVLAADVQSGDTIDGSDMIFLPVRNRWMAKQYDLVIVDEAQDMTTAQLEIAQGVLRDGGSICVVGDNRQAIFGFRGADSNSLDRLKAELNAAELSLNITYRCGKSIVRVAQQFVPDFEAGDDNPEGSVTSASVSEMLKSAGPGDFILSRVNAPLIAIAMQLLRSGKRTRVAGRDIGAGLRNLVRKLKARSVPELLTRLEAWVTRETSRINAQMKTATNGRKKAFMSKLDHVKDQADMIISFTDGAHNIDEVTSRIEHLFAEETKADAGVITCSSVHRAKGLEAERVFILRDTLRSDTIEEENISYVAITRAKNELVWVS